MHRTHERTGCHSPQMTRFLASQRRLMAKSKYEYVKRFERQPTLLPDCWPIVRLDGKGFTRFCEAHEFEKPNDLNGLELMNSAASAVMDAFPDIRLAFGQSDEFSFVFDKKTEIHGRRSFKLVSLVASCFTGSYVQLWKLYFPDSPLQWTPLFDARVVEYPSVQHVRDYLAWRQVDTHINNQYNTCYWALVKSGVPGHEAQAQLEGTDKGKKNALLFERFGVNYNDLPEIFKKGSVLYWTQKKTEGEGERTKRSLCVEHVDIIKDLFWETHPELLLMH